MLYQAFGIERQGLVWEGGGRQVSVKSRRQPGSGQRAIELDEYRTNQLKKGPRQQLCELTVPAVVSVSS